MTIVGAVAPIFTSTGLIGSLSTFVAITYLGWFVALVGLVWLIVRLLKAEKE